MPDIANRATISAKKALGLSEDPSVSARAEIKKSQDRREKLSPTTARYEAPSLPVAAVPAPAVSSPNDPALDTSAPLQPAAAAAPAPPAPPTKIKIGDKEYSAEELVAENNRLAQDAQQRQQQAAPPAPRSQAPQETPEQVAARQAELVAREEQFVQNTSKAIDAPLTEAEVDLFLGGGPQAVEAFQAIRKRDMATAILQARKGIAEGLNPILEKIFQAITPLSQQQEHITRHNIKTQFIAKHPDFAKHVDLAEGVAEQLLQKYPQEVSQMGVEQFIGEVARQTDTILTNQWKRFNTAGGWRQPAAPAPGVAIPVLAGGSTTPPAVPAAPRVKPPVANSPGAPAPGERPTWNKQVSATLRG